VKAREFFMSCSMDELDKAVQVLSPDATLVVPGHSNMAGTFHGPHQIAGHVKRLFELTHGTYEVLKWDDWLLGDSHLAALLNSQAQAHGAVYRIGQVFLVRFDPHDLLDEIRIFYEDQDRADRLFSFSD
jgi:ketosteroid isomerase-like protein